MLVLIGNKVLVVTICVWLLNLVNSKIMYSFYVVVEHSGTLYSGGHYMANVRKLVEDSSKSNNASSYNEVQELSLPEHSYWCHASNCYTREASVDEVHSSQARLLFFRKPIFLV